MCPKDNKEKNYNRRRKEEEKNPVIVDVKDDMSDPVKGLPKARP